MDLLEKYILARWCYSIGEDYVDDIEYRYMEDKLRNEGRGEEYLNRSWSDDPCPVELLKKYGLMEYYRNVEFKYESESCRSLNSYTAVENELSDMTGSNRLSYKLDGFNIQVNYYNKEFVSANTRGRTGDHLKVDVMRGLVPKTIPVMGRVKVTGELVIPDKKWKAFQLETGNTSQRSSVRTALAMGAVDCLKYITFHIQAEMVQIEDHYKFLQELGFSTPYCLYVDNYKALLKAIEIMGRRADFYGYPQDGLVLENERQQVALRVGKWQEAILQSYVTGYSENRGIYGNAMVADIAPVVWEGVTYTKVSVTNIKYIVDNNLKVGTPIAFDIRSAVGPVFNTERTKDLQAEYEGRYEEYCMQIKKGEK